LDAEETGVTRQWSWRVILQARSNVASRRLAFTFTDKAGLSVKQEIKTVSIKAGEMQTVTGLTTLTPAQAKRVEKFKASVQ
jgi:hypothetical protein